MDEQRLRQLLQQLQTGETSLEDALSALKRLPFESLGFAHLDHHRGLRLGFPEVVFGSNKTLPQLEAIIEALITAGSTLLVTRLAPENGRRLCQTFPHTPLSYSESARCLYFEPSPRVIRGRGPIAVVSAGTSDLPIAEEAALTAELMGNSVERLWDVGVAGIHRLLAHLELLERAEVIVVVAGMEGALPSVVGGLVARPVVAVPTSIGYGANFHGLAPLLGMLNSCAAGVTVVNIDNGFGAGYAAALMNRNR